MTEKPTYDELAQRVRDLEAAEAERRRTHAAGGSATTGGAESERLLETILRHTHMMAVFLDARFNFIWVNQAYAETCRHEPSFFPGKNHFDLYPHEENQAIFQRVVDTGEPFFVAAKPFEFPDQPERGVTYWDWSLMPVKDHAGRVEGLVFTLVEVTARIEAQKALRRSEAHYRTVTETVDDGIVLQSAAGEILTWNRGAERIFGIQAEKMIGKDPRGLGWNIIRPDGSRYKSDERPSLKTLRTGWPCSNEIMGVYRPSGELRWISVNTSPLFHEGEDRPFAAAISFSDITEWKQTQEELRESEAMFRSLYEKAPVAYQSLDERGGLMEVNQAWLDLLGFSRSEAIGRWFGDFIAPSELEAFTQRFPLFLEKGEVQVDIRMRRKDGGEIIARINGRVARDDQRQFLRTHCILSDITAARRAEEALRYERDLIEQMMETSPAGITRIDAAGRIIYANRRAEEILGLQALTASGRTRTYNDPAWKITGIEGEPLPEKNLPFSIVKRTKEPVFEVRHAIHREDGHRTLLSVNAAPLFDAGGVFEGMVATIDDITEKFEAEQKFQMLFREMIDGFALHEILCDDNGVPVDYRFLAVNPAFERLTGLKNDDLLGKTVREVMPGIETFWIETYGQVALTGRPTSFESYSRELDRHFQVRAFRPAPKRFACVFVDITDRKHAEKALRDSNERFQTVFNSQLDAIFVLNAEVPARVLESNRAATKIFGYDDGEMVGDTIDKLHVDETHRSRFRTMLLDAVEENSQLIDLEFSMRRKDGTVFPSQHTVLELKNNDGIRTGWVSIVRDLTERKEMESRLQQAQKMESIGNLAGGIAHDFNNILFPIVGMAELLLEDLPTGSPEYENAREIFSAGKRGSDLVKQILAFSHQTEHQKIPVHVQKVLREVRKLSRSTIPVNIDITHDIQKDCGMVLADPTQLHQIAMNLITNAYHAVEENGGHISIRLEESDGPAVADGWAGPRSTARRYALLTVSDTGCGIDSSVSDKIFEPYFTTKPQGKGTGLGLAVVYGIVREHGGEIVVTSEKGTGTTFRIYLPLMEKAPAEGADRPVETRSDSGTERILLVDDEASVVRIETQVLRRLGYTVTEKTSSVEALETFRNAPHDFDLVVSDMTMPNLTGDRLAREIIAIRPEIPIVICTGFSERMNEAAARSLGIRGFLMKPVVRSELARMVRKVLDEAAGVAASDER